MFLNELMKNKLIHNLYIFKSSKNLVKMVKITTLENLRHFNKIKNISFNLDGYKLYKLKIKNV